MHRVAEERLAQLRDTYGPGWMDSEHSETDNTSSNSLLQQPARTREYLRKMEATRSAGLYQPSGGITPRASGITPRASKSSGDSSLQSGPVRSKLSGVCEVDLGLREPSSNSVDIDLPTFTKPENIV